MNYVPTEHAIQILITNWLQYHGFYVERLNAGKYALGEGKSRRFVKGVATGTPDLIAHRLVHEKTLTLDKTRHTDDRDCVQLIYVEVKRPSKKPTVIQSAKMAELEQYGAKCYVATSIEDLEQQLSI
jgi:hypothetical protein